MLDATLYIIVCSGANRVRRRLQRLREPRYLVGALVGSAYLYFAVIGRMRFAGGALRHSVVPTAFLPMLAGAGPTLAGLILLAAAVLSMGMPVGSGLFTFSRAEREFLFPSPLSRRQLLLYRLMRSQWAVLFSALIISLTYPLAMPGARLRGFVGAWLVLMTCHVFFTGICLTRVRFTTPSVRARVLMWVPRGLLAGVIAVVVVGVKRAMHAEALSLDSAGNIISVLSTTCAAGLPRLVLLPFVAVTAPLFAQSFSAFAMALPGALVVYALSIAWVLGADEAFDVVTDGMVDVRYSGSNPRSPYHPRRALWILALSGRLETPFIWKTATQALRMVSRRLLIRALLIAGWLTALLVVFASRTRGLAQIAVIFAVLSALFAVVFGPQIVRLDLREDLQHLELLKTWPLRAAALIRGQMLGAAAVVTVIAWAFGLMAMILSTVAVTRTGGSDRLAAGVALLIVSPALILAQYTVHNAAALFFPAWFISGSSRPRGVDAMGQRLILLGGTWLVLIVAVLPAAGLGAVVWWAFTPFMGHWILPPAAVLAVMVIFFEVGLATEALGPVYERLDLTSVERTER